MSTIKVAFASAVLWVLATVVFGGIYPLVATALAQGLMPRAASGSILRNAQGEPLASVLIGQPFTSPSYFSARPSSAANYAYNATASSGSNLGPTNPALADAVASRAQAWRARGMKQIPLSLLTSSASGLDPHLSLAAAEAQIPLVAAARSKPLQEVARLVGCATEDRSVGVFGEPRVNVVVLNLLLDGRLSATDWACE